MQTGSPRLDAIVESHVTGMDAVAYTASLPGSLHSRAAAKQWLWEVSSGNGMEVGAMGCRTEEAEGTEVGTKGCAQGHVRSRGTAATVDSAR